jgi:DNA-binding response OmpR family regulator
MSGSDCPILIVEDDALLGFDLASVLQQRGYEVIGPCPDEESAREALTAKPAGAAFLDVNLGDGRTSFGLAAALQEKGVPFVFLTGYGHKSGQFEPRFDETEKLSKPCAPDLVAATADRLCGRVPA